MLYFHGTKKSSIASIISQGLTVESARATFTTNPEMSLPYSEIGGGIFVYKDDGNFQTAKHSNINFEEKNKKISGWVNRYKNEQFGYYFEGEKIKIPRNLLVGAFYSTQDQHDLLKKIKFNLREGKLVQKNINDFINDFADLLQKKENQILPPEMPVLEISKQAIEGLIRNLSLLQVRTLELSYYTNNGWEIENFGDHEVRLYDHQVFDDFFQAMIKLIDKKIVPDDITSEFEILKKKIKKLETI